MTKPILTYGFKGVRGSLRTFLVLALLICGGRGLLAVSTSTAENFTGAQQAFSATANLRTSGPNTATVSGTGVFRTWVTPLGFCGSFSGAFTVDVPFTIPNQAKTLSVVGAPLVMNRTPVGNVNIQYDNETHAAEAVNSMFVNVQNGVVQPLTLNQVVIDFFFTIIGIDVSAKLRLNANGNIKNLNFQSTAPGTLSPGTAIVPGNFGGGLDAVVTGQITDLPFGITQNLGTLITIDEPNLLSIALPDPGLPAISEQFDLQDNSPVYPQDWLTCWESNWKFRLR